MPDLIDQSTQFDEKLCKAVAMPEPDPAYVESLYKQLLSASPKIFTERKQPAAWKRWGYAIAASLVLALTSIFMIAGPQKVMAAIQDWLGAYIPSFGYVENPSGVRLIQSPVRQERDGGVMTIDAAFTDAARTIIVIGESHTPGTCLHPSDLIEEPYLLVGSTRLETTGRMASRLIFPALPSGVDDVILHMPWKDFCENADPGWEIPLHFVPAGEGTAMPLLENDSPTQPAEPASGTPQAGLNQSTSTIDKEAILEFGQAVQLKDGLLISGLLHSQSNDTWYSLPPTTEISVIDASQQSFPLEDLLPEEVWTMYPNLPANAIPWAFRVPGVQSSGQMTLNIPYLIRTTNSANQTSFELDLGSDPQPGQAWTPNLVMSSAGHSVKLIQVRMVDEEGKILEFTFETDATVESISVAGDSLSTGSSEANDGERATKPGEIMTRSYFNDAMTNGKHRYWIVSLRDRLPGPWQLAWQLPANGQ